MSFRSTVAMGALVMSTAASAQSLFQTPAAAAAPALAPGASALENEDLYAASLFAIRPPEKREFAPNDLITILVNESSQMKRDQKIDTKKDYTLETPRIEPWEMFKFFALGGAEADVNPLAMLDLEYKDETKSKGDYQRKDNIDARITARVLEVKPNGTLLLEARSSTQTDQETQVFLLSGLCRQEDVNERNTVLSSQIYDLHLEVKHEGQVREATKKGIFPIVLEALFNF